MPPADEPPAAGPSRSVERALEEAAATGILTLRDRKLREFPRAARQLELWDITQADLSKNRLTEIPSEICQYISLESLNLYHNCLRAIPPAIINLQALTYLNLSRSQLCALPPYLCCLPLKVLITSNNKLTSLPDNIGCLTQLRELDVSCNEMQMLPPQMGNLESLRDLNVRRNQLIALPEELSELPLVRLDFSCNKVTRIPVCYRHLRHLQNILLDNNPLQSPPAQICTKGKIHIFKYLNIEACKIVPDLSDLERSIRPSSFVSCLPDDLCGHRQHSGLDSGFNSVDSGSKRWSGNESTDELTDLSLRMVEISREQKQLKEIRPGGLSENSAHVNQDPEQIDFIDSSVNGEEDVKPGPVNTATPSKCHRTPCSQEENKQNKSCSEKGGLTDRLPPNGTSGEISPGKDEVHREGEERRRPETLLIWQEREKQLQSQATERRERGVSVSSMSRASPFSLQSQSSLGEANSRAGSGVSSGNSVGPPAFHRSDSRPAAVSSSLSTTAIRPDPSASPSQGSGAVNRPNSFLFRSSTRSNLKSSSVVSPVSPQSPPYTFPEFPADLDPSARHWNTERDMGEQETVAQLRKTIETRLNRQLPEDLGEALNNGVMLCQLVNHIRPRSISIIHIPSPAVPKLSLAKSRRNVESFLEACLKIGVPQESVCQAGHVLEEDGLLNVAQMVKNLELAAKPKPVRLSDQV